MRWQIGDFVFCDQQQTLTSVAGVQQLEPMMVELLSFFCQNTNSIVSVEQLIEEVWLGRIVSDNAVSKLITKLRKAFSDDPRKPRFIATFPKKGYKFIAQVSVLPNDNEALVDSRVTQEGAQILAEPETQKERGLTSTAHSPLSTPAVPDNTATNGASDFHADPVKQPKLFFSHRGFWGAILFILIVIGIWHNGPFYKSPVVTQARSITTDAGQEWFPAFSPDGTRVVYMSAHQGSLTLRVKQLSSGEVITVDHGVHIGVGPGDWSKDGKSLVYLVANTQRCEYYQREINGMTLGDAKLIHTCTPGSFGKVLYTHDADKVVFAENSGPSTPYSIFQLDLNTGQTRRVSQPDIYLGGNSQFDLHPTHNKLLISSPDKQQWEGFYQLDLETDNLTLLFRQDAFICCGIWDHFGQRVVLMGEYPAFQLVSYDLTGQDRQVIYAGSRLLSWPMRHVNGTDYVFVAAERDTNIQLLALDSKATSSIADDSVNELLATFSPDGQQSAYISMATGKEEVWLAELARGQKRRLTEFNDGRHYLDLRWSHDGKHLAGLTFNEIHLIDTATGSFERLNIPQREIRGVSFKSNSEIAFSVKEGERWRVYTYDILAQRVSAEDPMWSYVQFAADPDNSLWASRDGDLYVGEEPKRVEDNRLSVGNLLYGRQWNLRKRGSNWYWFEPGVQGRILNLSEVSGQVADLIFTNTERFDVSDNGLLFSQSESVNSNLYQTQTLPE